VYLSNSDKILSTATGKTIVDYKELSYDSKVEALRADPQIAPMFSPFGILENVANGASTGASMLFDPGAAIKQEGLVLKKLGDAMWTHKTNSNLSYSELSGLAFKNLAVGGKKMREGDSLMAWGKGGAYVGLGLSLYDMSAGVATGNLRKTWAASGSFSGGAIAGYLAVAGLTLIAPEATAVIFLGGGVASFIGGAYGDAAGGKIYDNYVK
jgi:hypothetical protein